MITKSKKFWFSTSVAFLVTTGFFSYPKALRWQVEKRLPPGVQFRSASLNLSGVELTGVSVNKGWVSGELDSVTSDFGGKNIKITGGSLNAYLDTRLRGEETTSSQKNIQFTGLSLTVSYHNHVADLKDVRSDGRKVCFSEAKLRVPQVETGTGCLDRESNTIIVKKVSARMFTSWGITIENLIANTVTYNKNIGKATTEDFAAQITFKNQTFLVEASDTTVTTSPISAETRTIRIKHSWLSPGWVTLEHVKLSGEKTWDVIAANSRVKIDPETLTVSGSESCSTWISSLPHEIKIPLLDTIKMSGSTSFSIGFHPKLSFVLKSDCRATCNSVPNLRKPFTYSTYTPTGERTQRETGPGSKSWVSLGYTGDMPLAVTTMEDPGFQRHRGFITQAFFNSFVDNIKHNGFLRGGSTITMQLAKNIWLNREKTLGRKIQEFFLAQTIESCYSKDEIMELYLNAIEFGPNLYGVGAGSQHWFKRGPGELTPVESFWLASILPQPSRTGPPTEHSLNKIKSLIKQLATNDRIPADMLEFIDDDVGSDPEQPINP